MQKKKLLFFGDLAPKYLTGTSISSSLILSELDEIYKILIVEEDDNFHYGNIKHSLKFINIIKKFVLLFFKSVFNKISTFYLVFSLSLFGSIKTLFCIIIVKIASPRSKVVLHIHRGDFFNTFYTSTLKRLTTKIIFNISDLVIVLSQSQQIIFKDSFKYIEFKVLANSLNIETDTEIIDKKIIDSKKFIFISNYFKEKGIFDLLQSFKELNEMGYNLELDTYGNFPSSSIKKDILRFSSENIHIHGPINEAQKHSLLRESACLILPSWNEGQPLIILEAMANATPIIATDVGLIPEILGKDYKFLYSAGDIASLKEKIEIFLKHPKIQSIGKQLYLRYKTNYSKSEHKKTVLEIFA